MKVSTNVLLVTTASMCVSVVSAFTVQPPSSMAFTKTSGMTVKQTVSPYLSFPSSTSCSYTRQTTFLQLASSSNTADEGDNNNGLTINPVFAIAWIGFLSFAFLFAPGDLTGPENNELIAKFIANPLHPEGVSELFVFVFSLFAFIPISLACLIMPGAKGQKLPATPFLFASSASGYFLLGIYMMTRKVNASPVSKASLGWFTSNVLENKVFNWVIVALALSSLFTTDFASGMLDHAGLMIEDYKELFSQSALASVSTVDLTILTLTVASMIPEDLKRRGMADENKAKWIATSTLLFPVIGSTLYCALRPELAEEE